MWDRGVFLTDKIIQEKAKRVQYTMNQTVEPDERTYLKFSNRQLALCKKRHNCKCFKSHGESFADDVATREALPRLQELCKNYNVNDIYNADEFGLAYSAALKSTVGPAALPGRKISKSLVTFLICANVDGTDN